MKEGGRAILLVVLAMLAVSCGGSSVARHGYLVPKGDRHVLDHTYDKMLSAL
jgi:hypothetical protein